MCPSGPLSSAAGEGNKVQQRPAASREQMPRGGHRPKPAPEEGRGSSLQLSLTRRSGQRPGLRPPCPWGVSGRAQRQQAGGTGLGSVAGRERGPGWWVVGARAVGGRQLEPATGSAGRGERVALGCYLGTCPTPRGRTGVRTIYLPLSLPSAELEGAGLRPNCKIIENEGGRRGRSPLVQPLLPAAPSPTASSQPGLCLAGASKPPRREIPRPLWGAWSGAALGPLSQLRSGTAVFSATCHT